jgi:uncharacterized protein (TIGR03067 family)
MRRILPLLAVFLVGFAPVPPYRPMPDTSKDDLKAMQGVWTERFADSAAVTITGDRMESSPNYAWKLTLYTKANPRRVAATGVGAEVVGKVRWGIYRLEKGKLIICWRRDLAAMPDWPSSLDPIHKDVWIEVFTPVKP